MFPEEGYFYISEDELMHRSFEPQFQGKPLAWVFYQVVYLTFETGSIFELEKVHNFYSKVSDKYGTFEILFSDRSSFIIGKSEINIFRPADGYFMSIPI
ncbi:hypothetical protein [Neisseria shayeganii]|uniref:hypothetical protein n=1 Tax=Neisseria shayeganii TaxID=607712 RepID=UPI00030007E0|nr:hypothetical protein [Neisseria shayeganii]